MVWDNPFDPYMDLCIETGDGNTIDLTPDGTKIVFSSHVPTDEEFRALLHIEVTSGLEWNPNTVKLGKVSMDKNDDSFELQQHVFGYHNIQTGKFIKVERLIIAHMFQVQLLNLVLTVNIMQHDL